MFVSPLVSALSVCVVSSVLRYVCRCSFIYKNGVKAFSSNSAHPKQQAEGAPCTQEDMLLGTNKRNHSVDNKIFDKMFEFSICL